MTGHRLIPTSEARDLRNSSDYDDWEYGTEPIPGDTHWVKVRTLTQLYRHLIYVFTTSDTICSSRLARAGHPRDSQTETHGSHPLKTPRPQFFRMTDWYADYYRQSRGYNWNDLRELHSQPRRPNTSRCPTASKHSSLIAPHTMSGSKKSEGLLRLID